MSRWQNLRVAREGVIVGCVQLLIVAIYSVGFRFVTEMYAADVFGQGALLMGVLAAAMAVVFQPLFAVHLRLTPDYRARNLQGWFVGILQGYVRKLSLLVGGVVGVGALVWSWVAGQEQQLLLALGMLFVVIGQTEFTMITNALNVERSQWRFALVRLMRTGLYPVGAVSLGLLMGARLDALIWGTAISYWAPVAIGRRTVGRTDDPPVPSLEEEERTVRGEIWSYGAPLVLVASANWVMSVGDRYIIGAYMGAADVGVYSAVYGLFAQPYLTLAGGLTIWLRPILFDAAADGDSQRIARVMRLWVVGGGGAAIAGAVLLWFTRMFWMGLFLAEEYRYRGLLVLYIIAGYVFQVLVGALACRLMVAKQTGVQFRAVAIAAIVNVLLNVVLVPVWGVDGAGLATAVALLLQVLLLANAIARLGRAACPIAAEA
jgi:O-antigen/teichoic acid export membrane protein